MHVARLFPNQHAKRFVWTTSSNYKVLFETRNHWRHSCFAYSIPTVFFKSRWSDLGVPFGPWRPMVEHMWVRSFWGLLSSPITTARFLTPCLHTPLPTFPNHPLSHPCQAASTPNLANFRSLKCTIYKAIKFGPMCTLRRSWSLFNETA